MQPNSSMSFYFLWQLNQNDKSPFLFDISQCQVFGDFLIKIPDFTYGKLLITEMEKKTAEKIRCTKVYFFAKKLRRRSWGAAWFSGLHHYLQFSMSVVQITLEDKYFARIFINSLFVWWTLKWIFQISETWRPNQLIDKEDEGVRTA